MKRLVIASVSAAAAASVFAVPSGARRDECGRMAAALVAQMTPEEMLDELMMGSPEIKRLGVPAYHWWNEALHGVARAGLATVFPQSIGMAASFDAELMEKVGDVVSTEARAKYNLFSAKGDRQIYRGLTFWSPNVNMFRDPRWGRGQETFGEDPFLSGAMGAAYVRGLQGRDERFLKVAACAKHFAVHSGPEKLRHSFNAEVSRRDLAEYYLPAFRTLAVDAKVESFMGAYSAINGVPCCADKWLLTDLLRGEWGFRGHVVSDVGAVADILGGHRFVKDRAAGCKAAIEAGLDLCSEGTYNSLRDGVKSGEVKPDFLAKPLKNLFTTRYLLGMNQKTPWDGLGEKDVATPEHRAVSLEMAERSLVLVKNDGFLPLSNKTKATVGVCGPRAADEVSPLGNYCGYTDNPVSCLAGIVGEGGAAFRVTAEPELGGCNVLVACIGLSWEDECEEGVGAGGGDRTDYGIGQSQLDYLKNLKKRFPNGNIVAVVFGGSPVDLRPVCELAKAVIVAWYPGEQGGRAVGRAIFGKSNVFGRLPMTYPDSYADLPDFKDYSVAGRTYRYADPAKKPAYPFGYGLSYTTYSFSGAKAEKKGAKTLVSATVKNTGRREGEEVVQLYVRAPASAGDRRVHHLEGFKRVALKPGESKTVSFELGEEAFWVYGEDGRPFVPKGVSEVFVGGGQPGFASGVQSVGVAH